MPSRDFSVMPTVSISRSKFLRTPQHKTSFNLGEIVPIFVDLDVLPGSTHSIDVASLIRMSTPVAPIMDNIEVDYYAFFVPNRLCWSHWKEFMGENSTGAGIYTGTAYTVPQWTWDTLSTGCLGDYFGLPVGVVGSKVQTVNALPARAYALIYNRWFRDQNLIAPITVNIGDDGDDDTFTVKSNLLKAAKFSDYFTRSLPFAQKHAPVTIPLSGDAPVKTYSMDDTTPWLTENGNPVHYDLGNSDPLGTNYDYYQFAGQSYTRTAGGRTKYSVAQNGAYGENQEPETEDGIGGPLNLYADLSQVTSATINSLRFAFQLQKLYERDSWGSRYWEILKAHFGVEAPDASLQDPEYLGHFRQHINIDQVVQTTGIDQATPSDNELGQTAAVSCTAGKGSLFTKSFTEHGIIMVLAVARHDQTYGQGIERGWSRKIRSDYYFPEFANLGAQEVKNKEIYFRDNNSTDEQVFGYQEAWAEYRYKPSKVTGLLNPAVTNSLGYWTLANKFNSLPTLSQSFIEQERSNLSRALSTGATGPDFIADFYFKDVVVNPMPMYSVPGLIDHH